MTTGKKKKKTDERKIKINEMNNYRFIGADTADFTLQVRKEKDTKRASFLNAYQSKINGFVPKKSVL